MSKLKIAAIMALVGANFLVTANVQAQQLATNISETSTISVPLLIAQDGEINADKFNRTGVMLRDKKKYSEAISAFTLSIKNFPEQNTAAYLERAKTYMEMGKISDALTDFSVVITDKPKDPEARLYRGTILCTYAGQLKGDVKKNGIQLGREDLVTALEVIRPEPNSELFGKITKLIAACGS
jgi:tetratricopeptide (TPR) repeat protein